MVRLGTAFSGKTTCNDVGTALEPNFVIVALTSGQ